MTEKECRRVIQQCRRLNVDSTYDKDRDGHSVTFYHKGGPDYTTTYNHSRAMKLIQDPNYQD